MWFWSFFISSCMGGYLALGLMIAFTNAEDISGAVMILALLGLAAGVVVHAVVSVWLCQVILDDEADPLVRNVCGLIAFFCCPLIWAIYLWGVLTDQIPNDRRRARNTKYRHRDE